jgi:hypothetical protein
MLMFLREQIVTLDVTFWNVVFSPVRRAADNISDLVVISWVCEVVMGLLGNMKRRDSCQEMTSKLWLPPLFLELRRLGGGRIAVVYV